jgi:hypothetical protein
MTTARQPSFRIGGESGRTAAERVAARVAERYARGILDEEEVARVSAMRVHTFDGDDTASEIFRRCCITWEIDRTPPITSHRPFVGPLLVALKRITRRLLRFQTEAQLAMQRDFNWHLLLVLRELLERERRRG